MEIKDSGARRVFSSGAQRDIQEGKGRADLLPLREVAYVLGSTTLYWVYKYTNTKEIKYIANAIKDFCEERNWKLPEAMREVSIHFEQGAKKYGEYNWQKGLPIYCYIDSGVRHYLKWREGWNDEPHDRAFVWNMLCLMWTERNIKVLDDENC